jgi:hypothetical protein
MYIDGEYYRAIFNGTPVIVEYGLVSKVTEGEDTYNFYGFMSIENGHPFGLGELRDIDPTPIKKT